MSAFRYRWVLLGGMRTEADNSESVALPPKAASALKMEVPTCTTRTDWRRPSPGCVLPRREGAGFLVNGKKSPSASLPAAKGATFAAYQAGADASPIVS